MPKSRWLIMYQDAVRGVRLAVLGERSFAIHLPAAAAVIAAGLFFRVTPGEWLVLVLCITFVLSLEIMNSGLERMAKAVTQERNVHVGAALDMAAGAVLVGCLGAAACGLIIFVPYLMRWFGGVTA
jgi:undecaprenol kinase